MLIGKQRRSSKEDRAKLKGCRWILVKNMDDLTFDEQEKQKFVYETSPELKQAHVLKEDFRSIFEEEDREQAKKAIEDWVVRVLESGLRGLEKFLTTLGNWKDNILNYFNGKVTNGFVEGMNNKIKLIKRKGFGFTNHKHFRYRVLDVCGLSRIMLQQESFPRNIPKSPIFIEKGEEITVNVNSIAGVSDFFEKLSTQIYAEEKWKYLYKDKDLESNDSQEKSHD